MPELNAINPMQRASIRRMKIIRERQSRLSHESEYVVKPKLTQSNVSAISKLLTEVLEHVQCTLNPCSEKTLNFINDLLVGPAFNAKEVIKFYRKYPIELANQIKVLVFEKIEWFLNKEETHLEAALFMNKALIHRQFHTNFHNSKSVAKSLFERYNKSWQDGLNVGIKIVICAEAARNHPERSKIDINPLMAASIKGLQQNEDHVLKKRAFASVYVLMSKKELVEQIDIPKFLMTLKTSIKEGTPSYNEVQKILTKLSRHESARKFINKNEVLVFLVDKLNEYAGKNDYSLKNLNELLEHPRFQTALKEASELKEDLSKKLEYIKNKFEGNANIMKQTKELIKKIETLN